MSKSERYGTEFGSGKTFTKHTWKLLNQLRSKNGQMGPKVAVDLAYTLAWYDGCPNPSKHIKDHGAWEIAKDYAKNNFLYGRIVDLASQKEDQTLFKELTEGSEQFEGSFEPENAPASLVTNREVSGFAQGTPYLITTSFWKHVDQNTSQVDPSKRWTMFDTLTDKLAEAIQQSANLAKLKQSWTNYLDN